MKAAHNTTLELTCTASEDDPFAPAWFMNGLFVLSDGGYRASRDEDTGELIGTLTSMATKQVAHFVSIADFIRVDKSCTALH